ncbi:MAG TPA: F0F1 ATP synthase subunit A [Pseudonocardiaceae bacterium]|jgi:F-type H+-transporting ATPase subunit a
MTGYVMAGATIHPGEHSIVWNFLGMSFNGDTIISTLVAAAIVVLLAFLIKAKVTNGVPTGLQLAFETITKFLNTQIEGMIGKRVAPYLGPLALALFTFVLVCNWLSVLPVHFNGNDYLPPPTADVNTVYALALMVFVWRHIAGARRHHGAGKHLLFVLKGHMPAFAPMWVIEEVSGVVSHALRLFGNLFAGGLMIEVIGALLPSYVGWALNGGWKLFDLFIGLIQAFIFALLTIIYFSQALEVREGH